MAQDFEAVPKFSVASPEGLLLCFNVYVKDCGSLNGETQLPVERGSEVPAGISRPRKC